MTGPPRHGLRGPDREPVPTHSSFPLTFGLGGAWSYLRHWRRVGGIVTQSLPVQVKMFPPVKGFPSIALMAAVRTPLRVTVLSSDVAAPR